MSDSNNTLPVFASLASAWENLKGAKWPLIAGSLAYYAVLILLIVIQYPIHHMGIAGGIIGAFLAISLASPMIAGVWMAGVDKVRGGDISAKSSFEHYKNGKNVVLFTLMTLGLFFALPCLLVYFYLHSGMSIDSHQQAVEFAKHFASIANPLVGILGLISVPLMVFGTLGIVDKSYGPVEAFTKTFKLVITKLHRILFTLIIAHICVLVIVAAAGLVVVLLSGLFGHFLPLLGNSVMLGGFVLAAIYIMPYYILIWSSMYNSLSKL